MIRTQPLKPQFKKESPIAETQELTQEFSNWADFARSTRIKSGKGFIPFDPYPFQEKFVNLIDRPTEHDGAVITVAAKTRQLGISETTVSYLLWKAVTNPGFTAVSFSRTGQDSMLLARRCKLMVESLGLSLRTDSLSDQILPNGSHLLYRAPTDSGGRGLPSVNAVFIDEIAFIDNVESLLSAVLPATEMTEDPRIVYVSTPNGKIGYFWDLLAKDNDFNLNETIEKVRRGFAEPYLETMDLSGCAKALIHWRAHPIYSKRDSEAQSRGEPGYLERIAESKKLSMPVVEQEYDLSFDSTANDLFVVIPYKWLEAANNRWLNSIQPPIPQTAIGCDPSRGGSDSTAICVRYDDWFAPVVVHPGSQSPDGIVVAKHVIDQIDRYSTPYINVDSIGVGGAVLDALLQFNCEAYGVVVSKATEKTDMKNIFTFKNLRSYMWWNLRELLDPAYGSTLAIPPDSELIAELCAPLWKVTNYQIQVESKDDIRKRISRSTDRADALLMSLLPKGLTYSSSFGH